MSDSGANISATDTWGYYLPSSLHKVYYEAGSVFTRGKNGIVFRHDEVLFCPEGGESMIISEGLLDIDGLNEATSFGVKRYYDWSGVDVLVGHLTIDTVYYFD